MVTIDISTKGRIQYYTKQLTKPLELNVLAEKVGIPIEKLIDILHTMPNFIVTAGIVKVIHY